MSAQTFKCLNCNHVWLADAPEECPSCEVHRDDAEGMMIWPLADLEPSDAERKVVDAAYAWMLADNRVRVLMGLASPELIEACGTNADDDAILDLASQAEERTLNALKEAARGLDPSAQVDAILKEAGEDPE